MIWILVIIAVIGGGEKSRKEDCRKERNRRIVIRNKKHSEKSECFFYAYFKAGILSCTIAPGFILTVE